MDSANTVQPRSSCLLSAIEQTFYIFIRNYGSGTESGNQMTSSSDIGKCESSILLNISSDLQALSSRAMSSSSLLKIYIRLYSYGDSQTSFIGNKTSSKSGFL